MTRKIILIVLGLALVIGGYLAYKSISNIKKAPKKNNPKAIPTVFTEKVQNTKIAIEIIESGRLTAKNKTDIYSEVQGIMEFYGKEFKAGTRFKKGEIMLKIRGNDSYAKLQAQKSSLQNLITSILPDLKLDYPEGYERWNDYVANFDIDESIKPLPKTATEKEKYFITGKNVFTTYYNTKNLEILQSKYVIRAPFNGILTEASITPGTVVRTGQKIGELIDPSIYELEIAVNQSLISSLSPGYTVEVFQPSNPEKTWSGKIARINGKVDPATQTVQVFIDVRGAELKDGLYLEARIEGKQVDNAYEVNRTLLVEGSSVYLVKENKLNLLSIEVLHQTQKTVVVSGLPDGSLIISRIVPGAYDGMEVQFNPSKG